MEVWVWPRHSHQWKQHYCCLRSDPCRGDQSQALKSCCIPPLKGELGTCINPVCRNTPLGASWEGNTSVSLVIDSKPAQTTETADLGLAMVNVLRSTQKFSVFQTQLWRGSSYPLPGMAPCHCARMMHTPKCPHHRSSLSFPPFSQSQASPPQNKLSKVFNVNGF